MRTLRDGTGPSRTASWNTEAMFWRAEPARRAGGPGGCGSGTASGTVGWSVSSSCCSPRGRMGKRPSMKYASEVMTTRPADGT